MDFNQLEGFNTANKKKVLKSEKLRNGRQRDHQVSAHVFEELASRDQWNLEYATPIVKYVIRSCSLLDSFTNAIRAYQYRRKMGKSLLDHFRRHVQFRDERLALMMKFWNKREERGDTRQQAKTSALLNNMVKLQGREPLWAFFKGRNVPKEAKKNIINELYKELRHSFLEDYRQWRQENEYHLSEAFKFRVANDNSEKRKQQLPLPTRACPHFSIEPATFFLVEKNSKPRWLKYMIHQEGPSYTPETMEALDNAKSYEERAKALLEKELKQEGTMGMTVAKRNELKKLGLKKSKGDSSDGSSSSSDEAPKSARDHPLRHTKSTNDVKKISGFDKVSASNSLHSGRNTMNSGRRHTISRIPVNKKNDDSSDSDDDDKPKTSARLSQKKKPAVKTQRKPENEDDSDDDAPKTLNSARGSKLTARSSKPLTQSFRMKSDDEVKTSARGSFNRRSIYASSGPKPGEGDEEDSQKPRGAKTPPSEMQEEPPAVRTGQTPATIAIISRNRQFSPGIGADSGNDSAMESSPSVCSSANSSFNSPLRDTSQPPGPGGFASAVPNRFRTQKSNSFVSGRNSRNSSIIVSAEENKAASLMNDLERLLEDEDERGPGDAKASPDCVVMSVGRGRKTFNF